MDQLLVGQLDHSLIPGGSLVIDVISLAIDSTSLIILVSEVELTGMFHQQLHHVLSRPIVFVEGFLALLEVFTSLALFGLVEIAPLIVDHHRCVFVDGELDLVHAIQMIQTHITFMMIIA